MMKIMGKLMMTTKENISGLSGLRIEPDMKDTQEEIEEKMNIIRKRVPKVKENILKIMGDKDNRYMGIVIVSCIDVTEDEPTHKMMVIPLSPDMPPNMTIEKAMNIYTFDRYLHKLILKKEFDNIIKHYEEAIENDKKTF